MLFNSLDFLLFFPIVTVVYFIIPKRTKYLWLLVMSYFFYMCWNAKYALLMLLSTVITYASGLLIERVKKSDREEDRKLLQKKVIVGLSFGLNLAILFFFKYFNFAVNLLGRALGFVGIALKLPVFDVILPVGISFYTFQALSYTMDVYRDEIYAEKNFFRYALFVSFFPQLVAGPIERSKNLLKQLAVHRRFSFENFERGLLLMLWGYFLKIVLADRIAMTVDLVYGDYSAYNGLLIVIATFLFAFQIYCDFYGYSVIAMGAAKILGIDLMDNFKAPYLSFSVAEFWRNWHISLTSWFKDYLYIPLGGSRKGQVRKYINKIVVFLASGLWHGAALSFVAWGLLNGVFQVIEEVLRPVKFRMCECLKIKERSYVYKAFQMILTFVLVDFTWIFFRADSLTNALGIIAKILSIDGSCTVGFMAALRSAGLRKANIALIAVCFLILFCADICKKKRICISQRVMEQPWWIQSIIFVLSVCVILVFGIWGPEYSQANFIYFQF